MAQKNNEGNTNMFEKLQSRKKYVEVIHAKALIGWWRLYSVSDKMKSTLYCIFFILWYIFPCSILKI